MPRGRPRKNDVLLKSAELIGWALGGLEREIATTRERLSALTTQAAKLRSQLGARRASTLTPVAAATFAEPAVAGRKRRRPMSAAARKRISERMKKHWAERRRGK